MKRIVSLCIFLLLAKSLVAQDTPSFKRDTVKYHAPAYYYRIEQTKSVSHLRFTPGINLFLYTARGTAVDLNPYITKELSNRWSVGIGWNQRISLNRFRFRGNYTSQLFGPRLMITYRWKYGFSLRLIPETMYTRLPRNVYPSNRYQWTWTVFGGIRKDFKISKNTIGYLELLYNIESNSSQQLYGEKVNLRVGIEFSKLFRKNP